MNKIILDNLTAIEQQENVKILLAIESGSRAWGFASPDSDYDVRFIYVRKPEDYLKLEGQRDVIEWALDDVLDINGWDISKALKLLYKSNPTLLEWCHSPIVYQHSEEFEGLKNLLPSYFSPKKSVFHYLSMAETNYKTYLTGEKVKMKKYFYALRPILAARWILNRQTIPPIEFDKLVDAELPEHLLGLVQEMVEVKKTLSEADLVEPFTALNDYIESELQSIRQVADNLEIKEVDWLPLNEYFLHLLNII